MQFQGATGPALMRANLNLSDSSFFSPNRSSSYAGLAWSLAGDDANIIAGNTNVMSARMRPSLRISTSGFGIQDSGYRIQDSASESRASGRVLANPRKGALTLTCSPES